MKNSVNLDELLRSKTADAIDEAIRFKPVRKVLAR